MLTTQSGTRARRTSRHGAWLLLMLVVLLIVAAPTTALFAQTPTQLVFHVYVDPIYGDDGQAYSDLSTTPPSGRGNPTTATVLQQHPSTGFQGTFSDGRIQHAPYSFRTLTNPTGALKYIDQFVQAPPAGQWPKPFNGALMTHIVIHCLPGLYGPGTDIDPRSGLKFNDEQFPVSLKDRDRVSLQGTSALNTIFDARETMTNVIEVTTAPTPFVTHAESFIDGLTIRGARSAGADHMWGAGIFIGTEGRIQVTISNCFITANQVGICISTDEGEGYWHSPLIANNTIAFNQVGIWNGNLTPQQPNVGRSKPRILNNIIDSKERSFPTLSTSCFEGVHRNDVTVYWPVNLQNPLNLDMNAWELGRAQLLVVPPGYPSTPAAIRVATNGALVPNAPRRDILPYTHAGSPTTPHGTLFISDIFRNYMLATSLFMPDCEHDLRLSPMVSTSALTQPPPSPLNPLVNMGLDLSLGVFAMWNGVQAIEDNSGARLAPAIIKEPGRLTTPNPPNPPMHAWDWDGEGFGNPRITNRSGAFPVPTYPPGSGAVTLLDLGADEMAEFILGGYIFGTTVFSRQVPSAQITDHTGMFFIDIASTSRTRPQFTVWIGQHHLWWTHVQTNPWPVQHNYTDGKPGSLRQGLSGTLGPFMRNLECDVSPHLALDFHPWWGLAFSDGFAANPWWHNSPVYIYDNFALYSAGTTGGLFGQVTDGTINPPGSWTFTPGVGYLFPGQTTYPFGPFGYAGGPSYGVNGWGFGDVPPGPDIVPDTQGFGVRFTCQPSWASNIQSFIGVNTSAPYSAEQSAVRQEGWRPRLLDVKRNELPDLGSIQRAALRR